MCLIGAAYWFRDNMQNEPQEIKKERFQDRYNLSEGTLNFQRVKLTKVLGTLCREMTFFLYHP